MSERSRQIQVGLVFTLAVIVLVGGVLWFKSVSLRMRNVTIRVEFPTASGLVRGDGVEVAGVAAGHVKNIDFQEGRALVDLEVDRKVRLHRDARITIENIGIMGQKLVSIDPGTSGPPVPLEGAVFQGEFQPGVTELMGNLGGTLDAFNRLANRLDAMIAAVSSTNDGSTARILQNTDRVTADMADFLESSRTDMREAVRNFNLAMLDLHQSLYGRGEEIGTLLDRTARVSDRLDTTLVRFSNTLVRVDGVMARLQNGDGTMGRLMTDDQLYNDLVSTLAQTRALVEDMKTNPKRYVKLSLF